MLIYIGDKRLNKYLAEALESKEPVTLKARGKQIGKMFYMCCVMMEEFGYNVEIKDFKTEKYKDTKIVTVIAEVRRGGIMPAC